MFPPVPTWFTEGMGLCPPVVCPSVGSFETVLYFQLCLIEGWNSLKDTWGSEISCKC